MERRPLESDWKTFGKRVPEWRERYLLKKNKEIIGILTDESKTPTVITNDKGMEQIDEAEVFLLNAFL